MTKRACKRACGRPCAGTSQEPSACARASSSLTVAGQAVIGGSAIDRASAAAILREARQCLALGLDASDACHWALTLLPSSRASQRAMIDWLTRCGALDDAAALISAALLQHGEHDWKLWMRRARVMLALGRPAEAQAAIDRTMTERTDDRTFAGLLLSAEIAHANTDLELALHRLRQADALRPRSERVARMTIDTLLAMDRPDEADLVLEEMSERPADLTARVLAAQQRLRDAREVVHAAIETTDDHVRRRDLTVQLIDVLERMGDWRTLKSMTTEESVIDPTIAARLARSAARRGEFDDAITLSRQALEHGDAIDREMALGTMCVATAVVGDGEAAASSLAQRRASGSVDGGRGIAALWLDALLGSTVARHCDPQAVRSAGADPSLSVLGPLLRRAIAAFEAALGESPVVSGAHGAAPAVDAAHWLRCQAMCKQARNGESGRLAAERDAATDRATQRMAA